MTTTNETNDSAICEYCNSFISHAKFNLKRHQQTKKCIKFQNKKELKERNDLELKDKEISLLKHEIALNEKAIKLKDKEIELLKKQIQYII